jgi:hypothetical protein
MMNVDSHGVLKLTLANGLIRHRRIRQGSTLARSAISLRHVAAEPEALPTGYRQGGVFKVIQAWDRTVGTSTLIMKDSVGADAFRRLSTIVRWLPASPSLKPTTKT